jgi:hypothetical protein
MVIKSGFGIRRFYLMNEGMQLACCGYSDAHSGTSRPSEGRVKLPFCQISTLVVTIHTSTGMYKYHTPSISSFLKTFL